MSLGHCDLPGGLGLRSELPWLLGVPGTTLLVASLTCAYVPGNHKGETEPINDGSTVVTTATY